MAADPLLLALALALVLVNAFFVAAEFAMVRVRATRMTALAAAGNWQARAVAAAQRRLDAFLSATQFGITLSSLGLGWIGEPAFAHLLAGTFAALGIESPRVIQNTSIAVAFAVISFLHIVIGELAPKYYAIRATQRVALWADFERQIREESVFLAVLDGAIARKAKDVMLEVHPHVPLRTLDAIHLATYLSVITGPLFTKDKRMRDAARLLEIPLVE